VCKIVIGAASVLMIVTVDVDVEVGDGVSVGVGVGCCWASMLCVKVLVFVCVRSGDCDLDWGCDVEGW
jgi:hypothetical protein